MKIKKGAKIKKKKPPMPSIEEKKVEDNLPKAYLQDFLDEIDSPPRAKLPKLDQAEADLDTYVQHEPDSSANEVNPSSSSTDISTKPEDPASSKPEDPALQAVLAAKAMIESQLPALQAPAPGKFSLILVIWKRGNESTTLNFQRIECQVRNRLFLFVVSFLDQGGGSVFFWSCTH